LNEDEKNKKISVTGTLIDRKSWLSKQLLASQEGHAPWNYLVKK